MCILCNASAANVFIDHKQYKDAVVGLQRPSEIVTSTLVTLEHIFMSNYSAFFMLPGVLNNFLNVAMSVSFPHMPCHPDVRAFFFKTFFKLRIHHQCKLLTLAVKDNKHKAQRKAKHIGLIAKNLKSRALHTLQNSR
jgi:hypothetical protein